MANSYLLLEMSDEPDCRFVAAWLFRAAQAQRLWMQALDDREFADRIGPLHADGIPDLAACALEVFGELEHLCHVAVLDLYPGEDTLFNREFVLLVRLGFFVAAGGSYWMTVPEGITLTAVKGAALDLLLTEEEGEDGIEVIQPEHLLHTLSAVEAEAQRSKLIAMRRFRVDAPRAATIQ